MTQKNLGCFKNSKSLLRLSRKKRQKRVAERNVKAIAYFLQRNELKALFKFSSKVWKAMESESKMNEICLMKCIVEPFPEDRNGFPAKMKERIEMKSIDDESLNIKESTRLL